MSISASVVKELREKTGVGMMDCKKGMAKAAKKADRATGEGAVASYIHTGGKIGVLVEINCETDFAARNEDFQTLVRDVAMHVAAAAPRFLERSEVREEDLAEEREIARDQAIKAGKPENVVEKIVEGKLEKYFAENTLLEQPFVKNPDVTVGQLITDAVARIGENIKIRRFVRFVLGE